MARAGQKIKIKTITILTGAVAVREPLQRSTTIYTGKRLDERIGSRAANVESILIQIVGEVSQQECDNCLKNNGPWTKYVRFLDIDRTVTACGNCQWNGQQSGVISTSSRLLPSIPRATARILWKHEPGKSPLELDSDGPTLGLEPRYQKESHEVHQVVSSLRAILR